jgi:hypothetical protein
LKNSSVVKALNILPMIAGVGLCQSIPSSGQTLEITGNLPGPLAAHNVTCSVYKSVLFQKPYLVAMPNLIVVDNPTRFTFRTLPLSNNFLTGIQFSLGDAYFSSTFEMQTAQCVDGDNVSLSLTDDLAYFLAVATPNGPSITYLTKAQGQAMLAGQDITNQTPSWVSCDQNPALCPYRSVSDPYFQSLQVNGSIPGKLKSTYGYAPSIESFWGIQLPLQFFHYRVLYEVDPRTVFTGYLPLSWFTDQDALNNAKPVSDLGNPIGLMQPFVPSSSTDQPVYLGANMTTSTGTVSVQGTQNWTMTELQRMNLSDIIQLPLPWMTVPLNQNNYFDADWSNRDYKFHAVPQGVNFPPMPPDQVQNLNAPTFASCPDIYTYYKFYKNCADNLLSPASTINITGLVNAVDQAAIDIDNADNAQDHTIYDAKGAYSPRSQDTVPADKQYDLGSLARTNPTSKTYGDPLQAKNFWLTMRYKHYCKWDGCSVSCYPLIGCFGGYYNTAWWSDLQLWLPENGYNPVMDSYINQNVDVTAAVQQWLTNMQQLFNSLLNVRDIMGSASPFNFKLWPAGAYPVGAYQSRYTPFASGLAPTLNPDYIYGDSASQWFGGYGGNAQFGWVSHISPSGYHFYQQNADPTNYNWKVYLGNPNDKGAVFSASKDFISLGDYAPLSVYIGDQLFAEWPSGDAGYRFGLIQSYPIIFQDQNGALTPIGTLSVESNFYNDIDQSYQNWIGNGFLTDNTQVQNDAPVQDQGNNDSYDPTSSQYQTDSKDPEDRDPMTWGQKKSALWQITKMIATSEALDLTMHLLHTYRKEIWYLAQKIGLEAAIRTTAKYAVGAYRVYSAYRQTMDQARRVRDQARRLRGNANLLVASAKNVWKYYATFDWKSTSPRNITAVLPMGLFRQQDFALWNFMNNVQMIGMESSILSAKLERYWSKSTGNSPGFVFKRREQEQIAQTAGRMSTETDDSANGCLEQARTNNPALLTDTAQVWKFSDILRANSQRVGSSGVWLENNYTRAAFVALSAAESDWNTWAKLRDRTQWQYNNFGAIFKANQAQTKADGAVGARMLKASFLFHTPVKFGNQDSWQNSFEADLSNNSNSVVTCGGSSCFGN